ncbi:type IV pilin-like G/H family protein [Microcoleus sp. LEGE 07076]|uniref:type IV pilin-like G/H family protein n=1 Tax=Microcoleus sp. LEGE 07076 TaxID=915322 RepID=UPI00187FB1D2|nr:type IV pilin-like G/H family protein [Microcoleus sp. LEGE 07076]MBE9183560.1 type IV pilin-like G/H family protein [Microcoleus sp. LEGE 07076]
MKTEFKAKFLQHINKRRQDQGFTLIELLVVIIIIGILSAIALPSFLSQANKAKQSEAKQYLSSINKGQQAVYAENNLFASDVTELGLGLKSVTNNYTYTLGSSANGATSLGTPVGGATSALKGYAAAVGLVPSGDAKGTQTILCETTGTGSPAVTTPDGTVASLVCANAMTAVTK